mgnify:CR=1 FL=1
MEDKENNIKSMIELLIANIDEFDSEFVTYKADSMKLLLQNTLQYINNKEQEYEELNSDNRYFVNKIISLESLTDKYELAFEEIEENMKGYCKNMCMAETRETCGNCQNIEILDIIERTKE